MTCSPECAARHKATALTINSLTGTLSSHQSVQMDLIASIKSLTDSLRIVLDRVEALEASNRAATRSRLSGIQRRRGK